MTGRHRAPGAHRLPTRPRRHAGGHRRSAWFVLVVLPLLTTGVTLLWIGSRRR